MVRHLCVPASVVVRRMMVRDRSTFVDFVPCLSEPYEELGFATPDIHHVSDTRMMEALARAFGVDVTLGPTLTCEVAVLSSET